MESRTNWVLNPEDGELYPLPAYTESEKGIPGEPISLCKEDYVQNDIKLEVVSNTYNESEDVPADTLISAVEELNLRKNEFLEIIKTDADDKCKHWVERECVKPSWLGLCKRIAIEGLIFLLIGLLLYWFCKGGLLDSTLSGLSDTCNWTSEQIVNLSTSFSKLLHTVFTMFLAVKVFDWSWSMFTYAIRGI